jgi:transglutaminase-like putative cysteine protease
MTAANQHIEIDGGVLKKQAALARDASRAFTSAGHDVRADLPEDAFGLLSRGLVVPLANTVAARARELLTSAQDLADRIADGVDNASTVFSTVEQDAVDAFTRGDG